MVLLEQMHCGCSGLAISRFPLSLRSVPLITKVASLVLLLLFDLVQYCGYILYAAH